MAVGCMPASWSLGACQLKSLMPVFAFFAVKKGGVARGL